MELPLELLERLHALGRREGVTLFMVLLGAWQVLLSKYSGSEDVVVGSPIAGRNRREIEDLIGFFVNMLVLRTDLSGDPSFRQVLGQVREVALSGYEHQEVPFEKLVAELQPERSLSHSPLFQVAFQLQEAGDSRPGLPRLQMHSVGVEPATAKFDLQLDFGASSHSFVAVLVYSTDLFERETIQRMLGHLERVLEQVSANADVRISELELMGSEERRRLLYEWNDTAVEYPRGQCIHELFEEQVSKTPDAVAAVYEGESLSYGELNRRANQLAHHLIGRGVGPEDIVGICLQRSVEMVVALLGVVKAGAAYLPLDPEYPADRLEFMLKDADPVCVLTGRERGVWSVPQGVELIDLGEEEVKAGLRRSAGDNPTNAQRRCGLLPQHPVYVIYTSGSTGRPKAVLNTHQGLVNRISWMQQAYVLGAEDRVLQKTPYSFDVSVWEFFWPLLFGARLVMAVPGKHRDAEYLIKTIVGEGISTVHFVPSMLEVFLEQPESSRCSDLRRVICSGEALSGDLQQRFLEQLSGVELHNLYGPTEASIDVTERRCLLTDGVRTPPIGKPIWNTRVYVLNRELEPVPVSVSGELYLAGVGLARGYLNRPGLTAERFVPDPFAMEAGERMYRTGDRMRWDAEGSLEFLGRFDEQVKIRGFRIEPGEVESVLGSAAGVREVRVMVREDAPGEKRLVAYVVGDAEAEQLRLHVKRSLPDYMVPAAFVSLERLPLTPNGKLDRKALPVPEVGGGEAGYIAPRTPVEEVLAKIWAEVLGVERVGVNDNFFALGGHSLTVMRLATRIRFAFGIEFPIRSAFSNPTIQAMAEEIEYITQNEIIAMPEEQAERLAMNSRWAANNVSTLVELP
jgi:amino acid adenylation domain-containing protein